MFGDPAIKATIAATKVVWSAYAGYKKGQLGESDHAIREEVRRRGEMVRNHLEPVHDDAHRAEQTELRERITAAIEACDTFVDEARFSVSHTPMSDHDAGAKLDKKMVKRLVEHDLATLERLREATQAANRLAEASGRRGHVEEQITLASEVRQRMIGARNHFSERNMILEGMTRK